MSRANFSLPHVNNVEFALKRERERERGREGGREGERERERLGLDIDRALITVKDIHHGGREAKGGRVQVNEGVRGENFLAFKQTTRRGTRSDIEGRRERSRPEQRSKWEWEAAAGRPPPSSAGGSLFVSARYVCKIRK